MKNNAICTGFEKFLSKTWTLVGVWGKDQNAVEIHQRPNLLERKKFYFCRMSSKDRFP